MISVWYLSNGSPVPTQRRVTPLQSYNTNVTGQVGLLRCGGLASFEGLYSCIIPNYVYINNYLYMLTHTHTHTYGILFQKTCTVYVVNVFLSMHAIQSDYESVKTTITLNNVPLYYSQSD